MALSLSATPAWPDCGRGTEFLAAWNDARVGELVTPPSLGGKGAKRAKHACMCRPGRHGYSAERVDAAGNSTCSMQEYEHAAAHTVVARYTTSPLFLAALQTGLPK